VRIVFAGNNPRGAACLRGLLSAGHEILGALVHPGAENSDVARDAAAAGIAVEAPEDVNDPAVVDALAALAPDVIVLAGYGQIVRASVLTLAPHGCLNLHAGKLPQYRGSSPLNWVLINGEDEFTISVIQAAAGVDTGDVLRERTFPIGPEDTIADLHATANGAFPELLVETLAAAEARTLEPRRQEDAEAAYYPLRFPDDGLLVWDLVTAEQAHNRIRALAHPYPNAFTFHGSRRLALRRSRPALPPFHGEPGRVYRINGNELLVCASDRCVWVEPDDAAGIDRYDRLATARGLLLQEPR
jgi:methionyl-tRNA formyltransferase